MWDVVIAGGQVIDGAGNPWVHADLALSGGRIGAVGEGLRHEPAHRRIDAAGLIVCPGFVDMHTHSDIQLLGTPTHEAKVMQGVTLEVLGQDGLGVAPLSDECIELVRSQLQAINGDPPNVHWDWRRFGEYLDAFDGKVATNVASYVGHGTVRMNVMGMEQRPPTEGELTAMQTIIDQAMRDGAVGLSTGLTYPPGMFASDDEIVTLCSAIRRYGGVYCTHHRSYGAGALQAYQDSIEIGRQAEVPVHLAHAQLSFPVNKGRGRALLGLVDQARRDGVDVTMDTYPYAAASTFLRAIFPAWAHAGGEAALLGRLRDSATRQRLRHEIEVEGTDGAHGVPVDWSLMQLGGLSLPQHQEFVGLRVPEAAARTGQPPFDWVCDLLIAERLGGVIVWHIGDEENVRTIMHHPAHTVGSDGVLVGDLPHPRAWGTFARYLDTYTRELGLFTWEEIIRKMTSLPAQILGLRDRGLLRPGMAADVVCFDPLRVRDTATYEQPRAFPEGIPYVFVNGVAVKDQDRHTGNLPGQALRRGQHGRSDR
ncbi:MAG: N-acyl-D-amino-acid deacylase [Dehalococcoidia bacterium]|nr:N-acyl-D-amino-acid deacylase [Dehalococcoidia bacterium]